MEIVQLVAQGFQSKEIGKKLFISENTVKMGIPGDDQPIESKSVERYLESKFGESLGLARAAMRDLVKAFRPEQLLKNAFRLYEEFRPAIPEGVKGWGAKGNLDIDRIRSLALEK
jgi:Bacterial regulatory proteins, luxR family